MCKYMCHSCMNAPRAHALYGVLLPGPRGRGGTLLATGTNGARGGSAGGGGCGALG